MNSPKSSDNDKYTHLLSLIRSLEIKVETLINLVQKLDIRINDIQKRIEAASIDGEGMFDAESIGDSLLPENIINDLAHEIISSKNMGLPKDTPINHVSLTIDLSKDMKSDQN